MKEVLRASKAFQASSKETDRIVLRSHRRRPSRLIVSVSVSKCARCSNKRVTERSCMAGDPVWTAKMWSMDALSVQPGSTT
eukprot:1013758-Amphidinium_carterae.1